jgi:cytochrome c oxidase subunit 2
MWSKWPHSKRIAALTILCSLIVLPLVVFVLGPNMPPGKATDVGAGQVIDNTVLLGVLTPFTVFIIVFLLYSVFAFRVKDGDVTRDGAPIRGHFPSQVAWLSATTVAVVFLAIFGSAELLSSGSGGGQGPKPITKPSGNVLPVQVVAQQWEFTYRYPTFGGLETPDLVIPVNTEIEFHVTSIDVIHSFWAYELGMKADANPGVDNVVYLKPKKVRSFQIRCAELCGLWHGYMFDTGEVVPMSQFTAWIQRKQQLYSQVARYLPPYSTTYAPDPQVRAG